MIIWPLFALGFAVLGFVLMVTAKWDGYPIVIPDMKFIVGIFVLVFDVGFTIARMLP